MAEGNIFTLCVSPQLDLGGYPIPGLDGGGYPLARTGWGTPQPGQGPPWTGLGGILLLARIGWVTPQPGLDWVPPFH